MEAVPSPIDVLDAAIDRAVPPRRLSQALSHVARNAAVGAIEKDGVLLRQALAPAFRLGSGDDPREDIARSLEAVREITERSRRRTNAETALAAAECALAALEIAHNVLAGVSGNVRRAIALLDAGAAAIDRQYTWPRTSAEQVACTLAAFLPAEIPGWPDYDEVARPLMKPSRRDPSAVVRAVEGVSDGPEAWEVLAARALIPVEWAGDTSRSFRGGARDRWGRMRRTVLDAPPDVRSAISLATDPDGMLAAERAWAEGRAATAANVEWSDTYVPAGLREALSLAEFWRVMVEIRASFPQEDPVPEAWQGEPVANVSCALAALLSLWSLGYALVSFDGERAQLAAPMAAVDS